MVEYVFIIVGKLWVDVMCMNRLDRWCVSVWLFVLVVLVSSVVMLLYSGNWISMLVVFGIV